MRVTRAVGAGVAAWVMAVAAGCGGGDDEGQEPGGDEPVDATTTTIEPPTTTTTTSPFFEGPEQVDGISGEGCTPGDVDALPEGWWAGEIRAVDGMGVDLDVVCFLTGLAGVEAAVEDTGEPEVYHVRNPDPRTYRVTFPSGDVPATCSGDPIDFPCTAADVLPLYPGEGKTVTLGENEAEGFQHVWVHVTGTTPDYLYVVFDMVEDYVPPTP